MANPNYWKVTHYDHGGNALGEAFPENLHFDLYLDKVGDIQYDIGTSHPLAIKVNTRPYYTDYILTRGTRNIQAGIHTGVNADDVASTEALQIAGLDWLHYFEGCFWPFDPLNPTANLYAQAGRDIALVGKDLLDTILAQSNRLPFAYALVAVGQNIDYRIDVADTTNLFDRFTTLSQTKPGFDFDVSPDLTRTFRIYAPKKGITNDSFVFEQGSNLYITSYGNTGPTGTHLLALATTSAGGQAGVQLDHVTQPLARRWDITEQFDNVSTLAQLNAYASGASDRDGADTIAFTAKYVPRENEDFWGTVSIGDSVRCRIPIAKYDVIDDYFRIVGITGDVDNEGEEEISITFDYGSLSL